MIAISVLKRTNQGIMVLLLALNILILQTHCKSIFQGHGKKTGIIWSDTIHDFGTVIMGPELQYIFKFTNNTSDTVVIISASGGDGGSFANYTRTPIFPREVGEVVVHQSTQNRPGSFYHYVNVQFSNRRHQILNFNGMIVSENKK